jgi:glyoxylase-like metal-dependent hydrolase (beta-lactamase superfamily II)
VIVLPAGNPSTWTGPTGNNTYLLTGRVPVLIDAGVGNADHLAALERALEGRPLAAVLITHGHADHIAGVPALVARWPAAAIRQFHGGTHPLVDNERVDAGDGSVTALHTPGHAPDHCCFESEGDIYCGDLVRRGGTIVIPASRGGDLSQYLDSLRRVRQLHPRRLLPGHGPIVEDATVIIDEYLRHRAEREAQIVDAMRGGCRTVEDIVARVYPALDRGLTAAAGESVSAHLVKLQREGRATQQRGEWTLDGQAG